MRDLRHLSELLDSAGGEFVTIATERGEGIVRNPAEVTAANREILRHYQIASDVPIGSTGSGPWACDLAARQVLGRLAP